MSTGLLSQRDIFLAFFAAKRCRCPEWNNMTANMTATCTTQRFDVNHSNNIAAPSGLAGALLILGLLLGACSPLDVQATDKNRCTADTDCIGERTCELGICADRKLTALDDNESYTCDELQFVFAVEVVAAQACETAADCSPATFHPHLYSPLGAAGSCGIPVNSSADLTDLQTIDDTFQEMGCFDGFGPPSCQANTEYCCVGGYCMAANPIESEFECGVLSDTCGNGICDNTVLFAGEDPPREVFYGENWMTCPEDCDPCGNLECERLLGENAINCAKDCG